MKNIFKTDKEAQASLVKAFNLPAKAKPYYERKTGVEQKTSEHPTIVYMRFGLGFEYHGRKLDAILAPQLIAEAPNKQHDAWMMVPDLSKSWKMYDRNTWNEITVDDYKLAVKDLLDDNKNTIKPFKEIV